MFDWATREEEHKHRILVFYKMADRLVLWCNTLPIAFSVHQCLMVLIFLLPIYNRLAEKMQSLFTIFAGHIVVHAAQVLRDNNKQITGKNQNVKILKHPLKKATLSD